MLDKQIYVNIDIKTFAHAANEYGHQRLLEKAPHPDVITTNTFLEAPLYLKGKFPGLAVPVCCLGSVHGIFDADDEAADEKRLQTNKVYGAVNLVHGTASWLEQIHPDFCQKQADDAKTIIEYMKSIVAYCLEWNWLCILVNYEMDACFVALFNIRVEAHNKFTKLYVSMGKHAQAR